MKRLTTDARQVEGNTQIPLSVDIMDVPGFEWRRLDNESPKIYQYFKVYLGLNKPRTVIRAAKVMRISPATINIYCARYKWLDRAACFDNYEEGKRQDAALRVRQQLDLEWLERREVQRQSEWEISQALIVKVREMLEVPLFRKTVTERLEQIDEHGRIIINQIIVNEPLNWSPADMVKFFDVASKMARLATGMDTDRKTLKIDMAVLSDNELDEIING